MKPACKYLSIQFQIRKEKIQIDFFTKIGHFVL